MSANFIARWDLDKTYLRTDFDTVASLLRTAVERADHKRTVPGAAVLMRELSAANIAVHILSGSPEQLRRSITRKLRLDGVRPASLTLKPNVHNLVRLRFRAIKGQLGYKLPALLARRAELAPHPSTAEAHVAAREILLGDDAEADAFIYALYDDVCRGQVDEALLAEVLTAARAYPDEIAFALRMLRLLRLNPPTTSNPARILIHLDRQSRPQDFDWLGPRVVPFFNYLQAALVLVQDGALPASSVLHISEELTLVHGLEAEALGRSYTDLLSRGHIDAATGHRVAQAFDAASSPAARDLSPMLAAFSAAPKTTAAPRALDQAPIDYVKRAQGHNRRRAR